MALWTDELIGEDDYAKQPDEVLYEKAKDGEAGAIDELRRRGYVIK
jgi:hypothetical protein